MHRLYGNENERPTGASEDDDTFGQFCGTVEREQVPEPPMAFFDIQQDERHARTRQHSSSYISPKGEKRGKRSASHFSLTERERNNPGKKSADARKRHVSWDTNDAYSTRACIRRGRAKKKLRQVFGEATDRLTASRDGFRSQPPVHWELAVYEDESLMNYFEMVGVSSIEVATQRIRDYFRYRKIDAQVAHVVGETPKEWRVFCVVPAGTAEPSARILRRWWPFGARGARFSRISSAPTAAMKAIDATKGRTLGPKERMFDVCRWSMGKAAYRRMCHAMYPRWLRELVSHFDLLRYMNTRGRWRWVSVISGITYPCPFTFKAVFDERDGWGRTFSAAVAP